MIAGQQTTTAATVKRGFRIVLRALGFRSILVVVLLGCAIYQGMSHGGQPAEFSFNNYHTSWQETPSQLKNMLIFSLFLLLLTILLKYLNSNPDHNHHQDQLLTLAQEKATLISRLQQEQEAYKKSM